MKVYGVTNKIHQNILEIYKDKSDAERYIANTHPDWTDDWIVKEYEVNE